MTIMITLGHTRTSRSCQSTGPLDGRRNRPGIEAEQNGPGRIGPMVRARS
ncbi:hypothetical protein [Modestobacter sp. Leaf380]|nr:hypothetical protein [Modestobacter sp. Leaf380]